MGKKILMLVGDYVEDYEAMVPFQILLMAGHDWDQPKLWRRSMELLATEVMPRLNAAV